jgi:hypothetical protein
MYNDKHVLELIRRHTNNAKRWRVNADKWYKKLITCEGTRKEKEEIYTMFRNALKQEKVEWYMVQYISEHNDLPDYLQKKGIEDRAKADMK